MNVKTSLLPDTMNFAHSLDITIGLKNYIQRLGFSESSMKVLLKSAMQECTRFIQR